MSNTVAYKHYLRVINRWPKDPLRPEVSFQNVLRRRIDRRFAPSANDSQFKATPPASVNEKAELEQVNVLYSLLENRYSLKYPVSSALMQPKSNPTYYEDLLTELREAPKRSWFARFTNKWKGFLRFS